MEMGDRCVEACLFLIEHLRPMVWILENPDAELANREIMQPLSKFKHTVTYCNYGRKDQKATLLYTNLADLNLLDCRKPGETYLTKTMLGHHLATAQAGRKANRHALKFSPCRTFQIRVSSDDAYANSLNAEPQRSKKPR